MLAKVLFQLFLYRFGSKSWKLRIIWSLGFAWGCRKARMPRGIACTRRMSGWRGSYSCFVIQAVIPAQSSLASHTLHKMRLSWHKSVLEWWVRRELTCGLQVSVKSSLGWRQDRSLQPLRCSKPCFMPHFCSLLGRRRSMKWWPWQTVLLWEPWRFNVSHSYCTRWRHCCRLNSSALASMRCRQA